MHEIELKLRIKENEIDKLLSHPLLKQFESTYSKKTLFSAYFDTPHLDLEKMGYALRVRRVNDEYWQTLKGAGTVKHGLHSRQEWEHRLASENPDLSLLPKEINKELAPFSSTLHRVFVTDFIRTTWQLTFAENTEIEFALDQGKISSGDKWNEPILEVELEIKKGNEMSLIQLAQELKKTLHLKPFDVSKAERGYRLYKLSQCHEN